MGTFSQLIEDLDRIASMHFDFLYLLPIHPVCPLLLSEYCSLSTEFDYSRASAL